MPDLSERIRDLIDAGAPPVTAEEVINASPIAQGDGRYRKWPRGRRVGAYAGVIAAAAVILAVVDLQITPSKISTGVPPAAAASVLDDAANRAGSAKPLVPGPGQFLYVRTLVSSTQGEGRGQGRGRAGLYWFDVQEINEVWSSPAAKGTTRWELVGGPKFISGTDRAMWMAEGSPQIISGGNFGGAATYYDVSHLPTQESKIAAFIAKQPALPGDSLPASRFITAAGFIENGASSQQRAALLRYMATIPGVKLAGTATAVGTHRSGTVLAVAMSPETSVQVILDRSRSEVVELRYVVVGIPSGTGPRSPLAADLGQYAFKMGEVRSYVDFLFAGLADSSGAVPNHAPPVPASWPLGTMHDPEPGSLYP